MKFLHSQMVSHNCLNSYFYCCINKTWYHWYQAKLFITPLQCSFHLRLWGRVEVMLLWIFFKCLRKWLLNLKVFPHQPLNGRASAIETLQGLIFNTEYKNCLTRMNFLVSFQISFTLVKLSAAFLIAFEWSSWVCCIIIGFWLIIWILDMLHEIAFTVMFVVELNWAFVASKSLQFFVIPSMWVLKLDFLQNTLLQIGHLKVFCKTLVSKEAWFCKVDLTILVKSRFRWLLVLIFAVLRFPFMRNLDVVSKLVLVSENSMANLTLKIFSFLESFSL